jgi:tetratricopeptide (TPR) repeat protein
MTSYSRLMRRARGWGRAWQLHFVQPLGKLLTTSWRRALAWSRTRSLRLFLQGMPALLAGVGLVVLTVLSLSAPAHEVEARYYEQGQAAFRAQDYPLALTCFERVCARGDERPEALYELALTALALGQTERALLIMQQLAPPDKDKQGYGEAHLWYARQLQQQSNAQEPKARQQAQDHLVRALRGELRHRPLAHGMLGDLYRVQGDLEQAEYHLTRAVVAMPVYYLALAQVYDRRGDWERARAAAQAAVVHFRARSQANLYDHAARMEWARAVTFLKEFPEAVAILENGWAATRQPAYKQALGQVHAEWCNYQVVVKKDRLQGQLGLVEKGLAHDPGNLALANLLLAAVASGREEADQARAALLELLAGGKASGIANFALGVDSWRRGERQWWLRAYYRKQAGDYWEQANRLAPHLTEVANTLAMHLIESDPPDPPRALQLIDQALEKAPNNPNYRDTRGRIFMKMGKWSEALFELQVALEKSAGNPGLHRRLAAVYERLDNLEMAAVHRGKAERLEAKKVRN